MHILVQCPRCKSRYQLEDNLRGQMVRCPNPTCALAFKVGDSDPPAAPPGGKAPPKGPGVPGKGGKQASGSVGSMVPLLDAEEAPKGGKGKKGGKAPAPSSRSGQVEDLVPVLPVEPIKPAPRDAPSWQQQAPPVRAIPPASPSGSVAPPPIRAESAPPVVDWRDQPPPPRKPDVRAPAVSPPTPPLPPPPRMPPSPAGKDPPRPPAPGPGADTVRLQQAKKSAETLRVEPAKAPPDAGAVDRAVAMEPIMADEPVVIAGEGAEPPPIRQPRRDPFYSDEPSEAEEALAQKRAQRRRRRARLVMIGLGLAVAIFAGVAFFIVSRGSVQTEETQIADAFESYQAKNFYEAGKRFHELETSYPKSDRLMEFKFHADMSEVRLPAYTAQTSWKETKAAYDAFLQLVRARQDDDLMKKARADIRETLYKFAEQLAGFAETELSGDMLEVAREARAEAQKLRISGDDDKLDRDLESRFAAVVEGINTRGRKKTLLATLKKLSARPSGDAVKQSRELVHELALEQPLLAGDSEVQSLLNGLAASHRAQVTYTTANEAPLARGPAEDTEPSMLVAPATGKLTIPRIDQSPVFALARGVLYALRPNSGKVRWAVRVGIDATLLPIRVPAQRTTPETVIVVSSDTQTVSALNVGDGKALWHHRLAAASLGRPVLVRDHIFVACYSGRVDEVDASSGTLVGYYELGQSLSLGGAYDEDSGLLYVPSDSFCVYILDVKERRCAGILYTEHPTGSLRGEPTIVHWSDVPADAPRNPESPRSCLILSQADGLEATDLRVFPLPIDKPNAKPLALGLRVRGWTWFPPRADGEKLAVASDAGVLGLYGIKQKNNRDKLFFPMLDKEIVLRRGDAGENGGRGGPADLVYFDDSSYWVIANGELHRLEVLLGSGGWQVREQWARPLALGPPMHTSQVDRLGRVLFLVTRPRGGLTCLASAILSEAESANREKRQWQTQLGLMCRGNPLVLNDAVLVLDQYGGLFRFDPKDYKTEARAAWHIHQDRIADPPTADSAQALALLPIPGGALALHSTDTDPSTRLIIRHFNAAVGTSTDYPCQLTAALAGTPGAWADHLVLPMSNGALMRKQFPGGAPVPGPNWRSAQADEGAPGYVVPLTAEEMLVTDGSRGLIRLSWPADNGVFIEKARARLAARIVSAPVVLPGPTGNDFQVFIADAENGVTLLHADLKADRLDEVSRFPLGGKITGGPWQAGKAVACVVDRRTLVLLDADKKQRLWSYTAGAPLVGRPTIANDLLVTADLDGRFIALDLAKGTPRGKGYKLKANVAPAASPVPFGPDRLFAPLTDGTVLLLSVQRLVE